MEEQGTGVCSRGAGSGHPYQAAPNTKTGAPLPGRGAGDTLAVQGGAWPPEDTVSVGAGFCHLFFPYINFSSFCDEFNFSVCLSSSATAASSPVSGFLPGAGVSPAMVPRTLVLCS